VARLEPFDASFPKSRLQRRLMRMTRRHQLRAISRKVPGGDDAGDGRMLHMAYEDEHPEAASEVAD
jgi:hypothetical protein